MLSESPQNHLCSITLLGNLVSKPDIRYQANPVIAFAEFTLATHSRWFDKSSNKFKEWTRYHTVKVIGEIVERALIHADKGDIILVQGYLINSKKNNREIIHARYAQTFPRGYAQSINQIHYSGNIISDIKVLTTEHNKTLTELIVESKQHIFSTVTQQSHVVTIQRPVHVWGKQALYLADHGKKNDQIIVDGKLSYLNNKDRNQFIDAQQAVLLAKH
ncbi:single-stranded DNA-binding protein [Colwellia sp. MB3u-70]|uniref:single-stranded DNA-binding protein n=1 Tax=unclassified Colwellia TaxID=196834 RepID=UPI0015F42F06|nr:MULTISPECIES: single-stranded DNA-binding protein [unclassified Colwellia]MBA6293229.1 single-stranded DNA-binding protein [Colwellia sp. MB3u-8]MBA6306999.1 single-stranded DNA-binding protein [Colwellia sp. MB3u-70]